MSDLLLMQKSTAAIYKCCMFRYTVHYNLQQGPFVLYTYYFPLHMTFFHSLLKNDVLRIVDLMKYREQYSLNDDTSQCSPGPPIFSV